LEGVAEVLAESRVSSFAAGEFAAPAAEYQRQHFAAAAQPRHHHDI
jgi:hypothetical protein